ncbi:MAG TPA: pitrilysin family protein, partial [Polyangiaceae bacterium]|nr:pitrilysin family protein [Polyangiaceae bacterium]
MSPGSDWKVWLSAALLLGSSVACVATARPRAPGLEVVDLPTRVYDLPSGLRVALERDDSLDIAGAALLIGAGSADERPGEEGLAHLIEHLAFQSRPEGKPRLAGALKEMGGGVFNGLTGSDSTLYVAFVPQAELPELLERFAGVLSNPLTGVDEAAFKHEQHIVRNELRLDNEDSPYAPAFQWLSAALFPQGHPYAHSPAGTHGSLTNLTLEQARTFARAQYRPERATLVVSGNLDPEKPAQVLGASLAAQFVGKRLPRPTHSIPIAPLPSTAQSVIPEFQAPAATRALWLGWVVPSDYGPEEAVRSVVQELASRSLLNGQDGTASIGVNLESRAGQSLLYIEADLPEGLLSELR